MKSLEQYIIKHRRYLHQYPETGFNCKKTSAYIKNQLEEIQVDEIIEVGKHSLIAIINNGQGPVLGLRADFDALDITEETNLPFKSKNPGKMHACGHDAHTAILLGACKYLKEHKDQWSGRLKFIFQEAEEGPSPGGALKIVESSHLNDCDEFYALHVSPKYETGTLAVNYGPAMAAADTLNVEMIGKACHAAIPEDGIDPIIMQAEFVLGAQGILTRKISPMERAVITIAKVHAGTAHNIIPEKAKLTGSIRTFDNKVREIIKEELKRLGESIAHRHKGQFVFNYQYGYDPTINSDDTTDVLVESAKEVLRNNHVNILDFPMAGSEDFSRYINFKKGTLAWLGVKQVNQETYNIHHSKFNLNEDALIKGAKIFIKIVERRSK